MKKIVAGFFTAFILFAIISCKKNATQDFDKQELEAGDVSLILKHSFNGQNLLLDSSSSSYILDSNTSLSVKSFKYYITNIKLMAKNNTSFIEPKSYHLIDLSNASSEQFTLKSIVKDDYKAIQFDIGIDSSYKNETTTIPALNISNGMFVSNVNGYSSFKIEAKLKTNNSILNLNHNIFKTTQYIKKTITLQLPIVPNINKNSTPTILIDADVKFYFSKSLKDNNFQVIGSEMQANELANEFKKMFTKTTVTN